ncbi:MAG TPA: hypothetical protein VJ739_19055, partial [Gemmataceae bacterium]|nr:hypothetical protein [Gemmataceae bacterium]
FRYFPAAAGGERVLLRVVGPPYYTLLRALDREDGAPGPVAYVEAGARLWVQIGHTHPFAGQVRVPEDKLLLLQAPRRWTFLDDAPFREVHEVLDFVLPAAPTAWSDGKLDHHLKVPLRLVPGDPAEADELWVLRDRPLEQLDELVSNADDAMLRGLSFAVAEKDGQTILVLRVRPTRGQPPQPVLDAVKFRTYQKLSNLFVPSGRLLHPPLGRHVLRRLLAEDPAVITWLYPHGDGTFTPETLPDEAFRPLGDWIDYVLDHDREALQTWMQAAQFDFESFVCPEEGAKPRKQPGAARDRRGRQPEAETAGLGAVKALAAPVQAEEESPSEVLAELPQALPAEPSAREQRLRELEEQFLGIEGELDNPERIGLWPRMALLNAELGRGEDAALGWLNALWACERPDPAWAWRWYQAEASRCAPGGWAVAAAGAAGKLSEGAGADLDRVLALAEPPSADARALAAYVTWAGQQQPPPAPLVRRLGAIRHFLEAQERLHLPARASWLAALAVARLSRGDVLGLARVRDRLLLRFYENGLRPELDLAGFLRFSGGPQAERARGFRDWVAELSEKAREWVTMNSREPGESRHRTRAYADLIFAYGLARLGEEERARSLLRRAEAELGLRDSVHSFLFHAFTYRAAQALQGRPHSGPLPPDQLADLAHLERTDQSFIDRFRHHSQILEPEQRIDAYRTAEAQTELARQLAALTDVAEAEQIAARIEEFLGAASSAAVEVRSSILRAALDAAPRVGGDFALRLLAETESVYDRLSALEDPALRLDKQAGLLEKGLFVAAHFGLSDHVHALVHRFRSLLDRQLTANNLQGLDGLAGQCFHGLRKLGLRDQIDTLLGQTVEVLLQGQGMRSLPDLLQALPETVKPAENTASQSKLQNLNRINALIAFRSILHVAGTWHYFGRHEQAKPVLDAARRVLLEGHLLNPKQALAHQQTLLARAYVRSALQGPNDTAQQRVTEILERLRVHDSWVTGSHFKLSQLIVLDAIVLGAVGDGATLGGEARRLLDEDEYLVRRRIHNDLRAAMASAGSA